MAKTTLSIEIEVTAPGAGELEWSLRVGNGGAETFVTFHDLKARMLELGLTESDAVSTIADAITEALGVAPKPRPAIRAALGTNANRTPVNGLRGRQREVLTKLVGRQSYNDQEPSWNVPSLSRVEMVRVLASLQDRGYVQRNTAGIWEATKSGQEYVRRPAPVVAALSKPQAS